MNYTSQRPSERLAAAANESRQRLVAEQRRSGNGSMQDVADFFGKSERQVASWKKEGKIGFYQIGGSENAKGKKHGGCVWFSARDVAEFGAQHHHAGRYSKVAPAELPALIEREWRSFIGALVVNSEILEQLAVIKKALAAAGINPFLEHKEAA